MWKIQVALSRDVSISLALVSRDIEKVAMETHLGEAQILEILLPPQATRLPSAGRGAAAPFPKQRSVNTLQASI